MSQAKQDFTEVLKDLIPFINYIHKMHELAMQDFGDNQLIEFATPPVGLEPVNGKLCFYVKRKLPAEALNDDWDMVRRQFLTGKVFTYFPGIDKPFIRIPSMIGGWPTDVCETET